MFPKNTKVLVVDDMSTMRRIIKNSLSDLGMENIVEAGDGVAAWEKIEQSLSEASPIVSLKLGGTRKLPQERITIASKELKAE